MEISCFEGLFGLEVRRIPDDLAGILKSKSIGDSNFPAVYQNDSDLMIAGSINELKNILSSADRSLKILKDECRKTLTNFENYCHRLYDFGYKKLDFRRAYVMGILNVTPDSFSDGGKFINPEDAVREGLTMIEQGADILDIGGESTRPGSEPVSANEELRRTIPVISEILSQNVNALISIDTTKVKVAEEALKCGVKIINDISGGTFEPEMFNLAKEYNAGLIIMHMKGNPKTMQRNPEYSNLVEEIYNFLMNQTEKALLEGVEKIFIDPGIGFGKSVEDNFTLLKRISDFKSLSYPVLIGLSRKSFIGKALNIDVQERDNASNALNCMAITNGARIIRTHNVVQGLQTVNLMNKILLS